MISKKAHQVECKQRHGFDFYCVDYAFAAVVPARFAELSERLTEVVFFREPTSVLSADEG